MNLKRETLSICAITIAALASSCGGGPPTMSATELSKLDVSSFIPLGEATRIAQET